jgi:hypothetical protein
MELLTLLPIFVAGFGCGYYVRDRVLSKRRSRYGAPNRDRKVGNLLAFKSVRMGDVWRALRKQPPIG